MAGRLIGITAPAPGVNGLNLQNDSYALGPTWAKEATNCAIDTGGRLSSRKGWSETNSTAISGTPDVEQVFEYQPDNSSNNEEIIAADTKIFKDKTSPSDITGSVSITANNWKFQNIAGNMVGFQADHEPVFWDGSGNIEYLTDQITNWQASTAYSLGDVVTPTTRDGNYYECTTAGSTSGTEPTWDTTLGNTTADSSVTWTAREIAKSNEVLSAYGRTWIVDPNDDSTVKYSDLLIPYDYSGGSAGEINLQSVWTRGMDRIVALSAFNNNLIIFGKNTITVYSSADDVSNISLSEVIYGTGCIARDSVQQVDEDIFYLSKDGVRSLKRELLRSKMPMSTITENVRGDIVNKIGVEDTDKVRSVYHREGSFYLITFPTSSVSYSIDVRRYLSEDHVSVFKWTQLLPLALHELENGNLFMGLGDGKCGTYTGYDDNGSNYPMSFKSSWILPSKEYGDISLVGREVILKNYRAQLSSVSSFTPQLAWSFDYSESTHNGRNIQFNGAGLVEYNSDEEYGEALWGGGTSLENFSVNTSGSGKVFSFHFTATVSGSEIVFFYANLFFKLGRMN